MKNQKTYFFNLFFTVSDVKIPTDVKNILCEYVNDTSNNIILIASKSTEKTKTEFYKSVYNILINNSTLIIKNNKYKCYDFNYSKINVKWATTISAVGINVIWINKRDAIYLNKIFKII